MSNEEYYKAIIKILKDITDINTLKRIYTVIKRIAK